MDRLTCTDADTRRAYACLLNAQIAGEVFEQTGSTKRMAHVLLDFRRSAELLIGVLLRYPKSRTAHRPTVHASAF